VRAICSLFLWGRGGVRATNRVLLRRRSRVSILVFGTGAIGSVIGGLLAKAGHDVTLYGRERYLRAIREGGLRIAGIWGDHFVESLAVFRSMDELEGKKFRDVLLCVKSFDTEAAARELVPLLQSDSLVYSLQNGVGNVEIIAERVGEDRTVGGRVIFGAKVEEPGLVRVTVYAEEVMLGPVSGKTDFGRIEEMAKWMSEAGVPTLPTTEIHKYLWAKVLYNSALNPLSVLFNVTYGELAGNPVTRRIMEQVIEEIFAVTRAAGIEMFWEDAGGYKEKFFGAEVPATVAHRSSMLQAIETGRRIDIDALNGAVVKLGEKVGVETPVNRLLVDLVRAKERFIHPLCD
jgi:2-dehydropantoate 2-reductase